MKKIWLATFGISAIVLGLSFSFAQWYILPNSYTNTNSRTYNTTNSSVWDLSFLRNRQGLFNYFYNKLRNSNTNSSVQTTNAAQSNTSSNSNTTSSTNNSNTNSNNNSSVSTTQIISSSNQDIECIPLKSDLKIGITSTDVTNLQNFLLIQKFSSANATGYFGPKTESAVKSFQLKNKLTVNGIVDLNSRLKIAELTCANDQVAFSIVKGNATVSNTNNLNNTINTPNSTSSNINNSNTTVNTNTINQNSQTSSQITNSNTTTNTNSSNLNTTPSSQTVANNTNQTLTSLVLSTSDYYRIKSSCDTNLVFGTESASKNLGSLVRLASIQGSSPLNNIYKAELRSGSQGIYRFVNQNSKLTFGVGGDTNTSANTPISQWAVLGVDYQYFRLVDMGGSVTIQPIHTLMYLTANPTQNALITQEAYTGNCDQKFVIEKLDANTVSNISNSQTNTNSNISSNISTTQSYTNSNSSLSPISSSDPRVVWWLDPNRSFAENGSSIGYCIHTFEAYCVNNGSIGSQFGNALIGTYANDTFSINGVTTLARVPDPLDATKSAFYHRITPQTEASHWPGTYRAEVTGGTMEYGKSYWIGYAIKLGGDYLAAGGGNSVFDLHADYRSINIGPGIVGLWPRTDGFTVVRSWNAQVPTSQTGCGNGRECTFTDFPADMSQWTYVVMRMRLGWESSQAPYLQVWAANGQGELKKVVDVTGPVGYNEPSLTQIIDPKFGIYNFSGWGSSNSSVSSYTKGEYIFRDDQGSTVIDESVMLNLLRSR